jgi:hypothetical protein
LEFSADGGHNQRVASGLQGFCKIAGAVNNNPADNVVRTVVARHVSDICEAVLDGNFFDSGFYGIDFMTTVYGRHQNA